MLFKSSHISRDEKKKILSEIEDLKPWYQPIDCGHGIKIYAGDKDGHKIPPKNMDRGINKWHKFIKPNLPFSLEGKTILDCGCNAGLFLIQSCREGAKQAYGVEVDPHYFKQTNYVKNLMSKLDQKEYPIEVFNSSFEDFDYNQLPEVDIAFFINTIYHIGRRTASDASLQTVLEIQGDLVKRVAQKAKYIYFQGNPLEDGGRGKGRDSILEIIKAAGLKVHSEKSENDARGLAIVACSD